jgi:DNA-binding NtrC family response regulator
MPVDGSAHILLVDDEAALVNLMHMFLTRLGYSAEKKENAAGALEIVKANPEHFKVAVVDLTLPDKPGQELALELAEISPQLKILVCSGYPFELSSLPNDKQARFGFLQKPFLPKMLAASIEELLNR